MVDLTRADPDLARLATVGVLGGMSSASTIEYYRLLDRGVNRALGGHHAAEILVASVNFGNVERFIREERWDAAGRYLSGKAANLERGGADFVVMATNTMHKVAPAIEDALSIPFVHLVDVVGDAITEAGQDTVGLLGTKTTMDAGFYRNRLAEHGVDVLVPDADARAAVDRIIFDELVHGEVRDESRETYLSVMDDLVERGAEGVVLGCTEIELLVDSADFDAVPLFDSTALHAERAVDLCLHPERIPED